MLRSNASTATSVYCTTLLRFASIYRNYFERNTIVKKNVRQKKRMEKESKNGTKFFTGGNESLYLTEKYDFGFKDVAYDGLELATCGCQQFNFL